MKLGVHIGGGVKDGQYSYINDFIDYLERIIDIVIKLFTFFKEDKTTAPATEEESTTVANG